MAITDSIARFGASLLETLRTRLELASVEIEEEFGRYASYVLLSIIGLFCGFVTLLLLIQYPMWLGKGGWLRVWELDKQVSAAQKKNEDLKERNNKLATEVEDLKLGTGAVEERARFELGMIKRDEIFVQILSAGTELKSNPAPALGSKPVANTRQ